MNHVLKSAAAVTAMSLGSLSMAAEPLVDVG